MKAIKVIILLFFTCFSLVFAQQSNEALMQTTRDAINLRGLVIPTNGSSMALFGIKGAKGDVVGDPYLDSAWQKGNIKLLRKIGPPGREGDSISNVSLRLDLWANELEIKVDNEKDIRVVGADMIALFTFNTPSERVFVNTKGFNCEDELKGFIEIIEAGRLSLLAYTKLNIIKPTYNEAMNTGSKDTKISKNNQFYYLKGLTLYRLGSTKKKLLEAMPDRADDIEKFLKTNDLSLKNREDLGKIFAYYNSL
jgi:hypothetical protein